MPPETGRAAGRPRFGGSHVSWPMALLSDQRSVESLSSPLSPLSESLSLPESWESLSSPLSPESASSPLSPSLTVAPPCARTLGQTVLISSSSKWVVSTPITKAPVLRDVRSPLRTTEDQAKYPTSCRRRRHYVRFCESA